MAGRAIRIAGDSPAALAYVAGVQVLGWKIDAGQSADQVIPGPLAPSLAQADALIAAGGRRAFGWPLVSTSPVQELLRRAGSVGGVTAMSSRSTRPVPHDAASSPAGVLVHSAHDHVALMLLTAQLTALGSPRSVTATASIGAATRRDESVDVAIEFEGGLTASVHADWRSPGVFSQEFQLAGAVGVLRSETDPRLALEFNGEPVPLPAPRVRDEQHRELHESGVIDMLRTIGAGFDNSALPHAFTLEFGRDVLEVIIASYQSIADQRTVTLPFAGDRTATPASLISSCPER